MKPDRLSLPLALALAATAVAGESADYSISPESPAAGGRAASAKYTLDSSTASGGTSGGVAISAAFTLREGFAGAIHDPVSLDLTTAPLTVDEGGTRQLAASLLLDDASQLPLAPSAVSWSVLNGPLTVDFDGLATAGSVTQDTGATVQGGYLALTDTLTLTVLNNHGGQSYTAWAVTYAGGQAANLDFNNDGVQNGVAYFMNATGLATNPGFEGGEVTWPYLNAVASFEVQVSANLANWVPANPLDIATIFPGQVIYTMPSGAAQIFCRLVVTP